MENKLFQLVAQYGRVLQQWLFPRLEEELGPLSERQQQLVAVLGWVELEAALPGRGRSAGRPQRWLVAVSHRRIVGDESGSDIVKNCC